MWNFLLILPEMDDKNQQPCTSTNSPGTIDSMSLRLAPVHPSIDDDHDQGGNNGDYENRSECDSLSEIIVSFFSSYSVNSCQKFALRFP